MPPRPRQSWASSPAVRRAMQAVRIAGTAPETALRDALGAPARRGAQAVLRPSPGVRVRPDLVWRARRVAVFVDGCFWHACPRHGSRPRAHARWWAAKFAGNRARDRRQRRALRRAGWVVVAVWEHEPPDRAAARVLRALGAR